MSDVERDVNELNSQLDLLESDNEIKKSPQRFESTRSINKSILDELKRENMVLKEQIRVLKHEKQSTSSSAQNAEKLVLERRQIQLRHALDNIKFRVKSLKKTISKSKMEEDQYILESMPYLDEKSKSKNRIRTLEKEIDDVFIRINEAREIGHARKHEISGLKDEQKNFDSKIFSLEKTKKEKKKILSRIKEKLTLETSKKLKKISDLKKLKHEYFTIRKQSSKLIEEEKRRIKNRIKKTIQKSRTIGAMEDKRMQKSTSQKSVTKKKFDNEKSVYLDMSEILPPTRTMNRDESVNISEEMSEYGSTDDLHFYNSSIGFSKRIENENEKKMRKARESTNKKYHELVKQWYGIKKKTGTKNFNGILQRFMNLEATQNELKQKLKLEMDRHEKLKEMCEKMSEKYEKLKYGVVENFELNDVIKKYSKNAEVENAEIKVLESGYKDMRMKYEMLIVYVKHLYELLQSAKVTESVRKRKGRITSNSPNPLKKPLINRLISYCSEYTCLGLEREYDYQSEHSNNKKNVIKKIDLKMENQLPYNSEHNVRLTDRFFTHDHDGSIPDEGDFENENVTNYSAEEVDNVDDGGEVVKTRERVKYLSKVETAKRIKEFRKNKTQRYVY